MEAIVLAGGFGTRLAGVVSDVPKPMAPVGDKPFLEIVLDYLAQQNVDTVILAVGYKHEVISDYFGDSYGPLNLKYQIESDPLGTGGAILNAMELVTSDHVFVINGDTFYSVDLCAMRDLHVQSKAQFTMALKPLKDFDRYGVVKIGDSDKVIAFEEKKQTDEGLINGGIYILDSKIFAPYQIAMPFSFEKEIMEKKVEELDIQGYVNDGYFIDIGIPSDYAHAQTLDFAALG